MRSQDVFEHFGGKSETARALGISPQAVNDWGEEVPPLRQLHVERVTDGLFKAAADVFEQISKRHSGRAA